MATRDFTANVISASKVEPSGPYQNSTASGVWDLSEQFDLRKGGNWPETGVSLQRALFGPRNSSPRTAVDQVDISTLGNGTDFGGVTTHDNGGGVGFGSDTRCIFTGGAGNSNIIQFATFSTSGDFADFGDLTVGRINPAGFASNTRGCTAGGQAGAASDVIEYVTIASAGNATDFGDLDDGFENIGGGFASSAGRGIIAGGYHSGSPKNKIQYVTISSTGNSTDFGDLTVARQYVGGLASATRGVTFGGEISNGSTSDVMDYITIGSTGNATDFGDLTAATKNTAGAASATRGIRAGGTKANGSGSVNTIDYITIGSTGNAQDFGDLSSSSNNDNIAGAASSTPSSQP